MYIVTGDFYYHDSWGINIGLIGIFDTIEKAQNGARTVAKEIIDFNNGAGASFRTSINITVEEFVNRFMLIKEVETNEIYGLDPEVIEEKDYYDYPIICLGEYME